MGGGSLIQDIARQRSEQTMVSAPSVLVSSFDFFRPDFPAGKCRRLCSPPIIVRPVRLWWAGACTMLQGVSSQEILCQVQP